MKILHLMTTPSIDWSFKLVWDIDRGGTGAPGVAFILIDTIPPSFAVSVPSFLPDFSSLLSE